jgi:3-oxoacyl-[acyl-carrier protein] reductase
MKNVLITGGARGIGAATAKKLASEGYRVFINYVNSTEVAESLANEIKQNGGEAHTIRADVRDDAQLKKMFDTIKTEHGGVDILVSNANMNFTPKLFVEQSWEEFSQKLNDELHASYMAAKFATESMIKKKFGRLIFISSTLSEDPLPRFIAHGSAKGALDSFNKYLAQELGAYGIKSTTPTGKIAVPEDIANAVSFFVRDESSHVTGTYMPVCGGAYLS